MTTPLEDFEALAAELIEIGHLASNAPMLARIRDALIDHANVVALDAWRSSTSPDKRKPMVHHWSDPAGQEYVTLDWYDKISYQGSTHAEARAKAVAALPKAGT